MQSLKISLFMCLITCQSVLYAETMTIEQVLQKVMDHYPSIKSAAIQVQKAKEENTKVQSQLSWLLNSKAGYTRDTSLFGTATDRYNLGASVNRSLEGGGVLGFNAAVSHEDAEDSFGPTFANPSTKTRVDVNYRHKLEKGADNPEYKENLQVALAGEKIALSQKLGLYDQLASQIIDLYVSASITQARINNIDKTIERSKRLKKYIEGEFKLGLSEEKDVLQVDARLSINEADKKSLQVLWKQQLISLNRLMGHQWDRSIEPVTEVVRTQSKVYAEIYQQSQDHSPALKGIEGQLQLAESAIRSSRDQRKDELDLVLFLGNEFNQGDTSTDDLDESELIGGISLEFNRGLDKSGFDAALRQAHYDRGIALEDKKQILEDIQYEISSLLAEIDSSELALTAFQKSVKAEKKKLDEAVIRYKDGRIETDRIIDFESQLSTAELSLDLQTIELIRRYHQLNLLRGEIWKNIIFPGYTFDEYTKSDVN